MFSKGKIILPVAVALVGLTACGDDDATPGTTPPPPTTQSNTIVDLAAADGRFTTLVGALQATGLDAALAEEGPFTVFAPTDDAFGLLPDGLVASLDNDTLSAILTYHVVGAKVMASDVVALDSAESLSMEMIDIAVRGGTVVLDGRVQVTQTDIMGSNGIIHVIDAVMLPGDFPGTVVDALIASPRYSTLVGAVVAADLAGTLSAADGITVFAPSNDGFARLPDGLVASLDIPTLTAILAYHVLGTEVDAAGAIAADGNSVTTFGGSDFLIQVDGTVVINGRSQVEYTDIKASNGIIHILDSVLVPGDFPGTIVDALASYPRFDTLVGAVAAQDLAGTLSDTMGAGFTVFAPTDSAFAPVDLSGFSSMELTSILTYHVLPEPKDAGMVVGSASHATVEGSNIAIDTSMGVNINGQADVTFTDINTTNGIIHVIDGVLVPATL
jgi:transforming growth factor-beta-induced protein